MRLKSIRSKNKKLLALLVGLSLMSGALGAGTIEASWKEVDHTGQEVEIPESKGGILALNPLLMEGLFALGITPLGKVDEYRIRKEGINLPSVGTQPNVDIESIYRLTPSLVIGHIRFHGNIAKTLRENGVSVYLVDPARMGDNPMLDSVMFLGKLLRREATAEDYADRTEAIARDLRGRITSETDVRSAIILQDGDRIAAAQNATAYGSILRALGIKNIVPDGILGSNKESFVDFDIETIISSDPDVILIVASSDDPDRNRATVEKFTKNSIWMETKAVRNDMVLILPFKVNPGRGTAEELLRLTAETILGDR